MVMQTLTIASDGELFTRAFGNYQVKVCVIFLICSYDCELGCAINTAKYGYASIGNL